MSGITRGVCTECGMNPQVSKGRNKNGERIYRKLCNSCYRKKYGINSYAKYKKLSCEKCGFKPVHSCQLDVDHKDGNHKNNDQDNLQTLCANCHRLKTYLNNDWDT